MPAKPDPNAKPGTYSRYVESPKTKAAKTPPYTTKSQRAKAVGNTPPAPPKRGRQPGENPPPPPATRLPRASGVQLKGPAQGPGSGVPMPPGPPGRRTR